MSDFIIAPSASRDLSQISEYFGSLVPMVISKTYLNKQANNFSLKDSKVLKP